MKSIFILPFALLFIFNLSNSPERNFDLAISKTNKKEVSLKNPADANLKIDFSIKDGDFNISDINSAFSKNSKILSLDVYHENPFCLYEGLRNSGFKTGRNKVKVFGSLSISDYLQGKLYSEGEKNQNMVLIKAGSFIMGSPTTEPSRSDNETQHKVKFTYNFLMCKYEVTQTEYENLIGNNPSNYVGCGSCPVEKVSWWDAIKYCNALSKKEGFPLAYNESSGHLIDSNGNVTSDITKVKGYRLPTEAEWEYVARAGTSSPYNTGSNITTSQVNYNGNYPNDGNSKGEYRKKPISIGKFSPNSWGLYDMHGNVWEWCHDWYGDYNDNETNPIGKTNGSLRVMRGGSWLSTAGNCRSARRMTNKPSESSVNTGFRVVRTV
ncbi:MAG: formylglycine-generating enzyme family protein [Bacteroidales bacterium]|nr:formylglycine-generating enzyme family protein [Bacteroidales bacterium]